MAEGGRIAKRVELFKNTHGTLPNSLEEIGVQQNEGADALYYLRQDRTDGANYMIWFGTNLGESMTYFSDTQQWEDRYRTMH